MKQICCVYISKLPVYIVVLPRSYHFAVAKGRSGLQTWPATVLGKLSEFAEVNPFGWVGCLCQLVVRLLVP